MSPDLARGRGETEGKWAEDSKSETSSIDELDSISMRSRRLKLPSNLKQNGDTSDDIEDVKKEEELEEDPRDNPQENEKKENEENDKKLVENSTNQKEGESKESEGEVRTKKAEDGLGDETDIATEVMKQNSENRQKEEQTTKLSSAKPRKKVKSIRFKDEMNEKSPKKADKTKEKDGQSGEANQEEKSDDHVNPYLDEWLGVKKKEVDGRYKPGKPPPNRY